jgi:hypothetical protein
MGRSGRNEAARLFPAKDNPDVDRDAVGENLQDPGKRNVSDGMKTKDDK